MWSVEHGRLVVVLPDGTSIQPSAAEIFGAEFRGRLNVRGQAVPRPSDELAQIRFSRYPLEARILLAPPSEDLSRPATCSIELTNSIQSLAAPPPGGDYVLTDREWIPIALETLEDARATLVAAGITRPGPITIRQYFDLHQRGQAAAVFVAVPQDAGGGPAEPCVPSGAEPLLEIDLYPYQVAGLERLLRLSGEGLGALLADEMGLGKTAQAIGLLASGAAAGRGPCLVVAPATLLENWRRELAKFAPRLTTSIHRGGQRTGFPSVIRSNNVVVTSYETAVRDLSILKMVEWETVVLDEAQAIKSPTAQRTVAIKQLPRRVSLAMTGTPVENRLQDLWSIMDFVVPGLLGSHAEFSSRFEDTSQDAAALEPLVRPLVIRRRVSEVARDLPPRIDIPQAIDLAPGAAQEYEEIRAAIVSQHGPSATLVALTKLRMFCTHPFLVSGPSGDPMSRSTKYARLLEILEEIALRRQKAIVFTSYTGMIDLLVSDLTARLGLPSLWVDGRVPVTERQGLVDDFGQRVGPAVLVLNPRAAGTGLNITAATHVIHYNLEWNPAVEDQATARAHRLGQTHPVTVHRLFHAATVEEVIDQRMARKRELAEHAVVGANLDAEDLADVMRALRISPLPPPSTP